MDNLYCNAPFVPLAFTPRRLRAVLDLPLGTAVTVLSLSTSHGTSVERVQWRPGQGGYSCGLDLNVAENNKVLFWID